MQANHQTIKCTTTITTYMDRLCRYVARMWICPWVDEPESVGYMDVSEDAETRYILEVDMEYPAEIYDQHNDY